MLLSNNQATPTAQVNFRLLNGADATPLNFDERNIEGSFAPNPFQTNLYRFGGNAGQHVYFDALGGAWPNTWTLYGPGGQTIDGQAIYSDLFNGEALALPGDGEYLLALQGQNGSPATYKFRAISREFRTDNLSIGDTASGSISKAGEQDTYEIELDAGQRLYFDGIIGDGTKNVQLVSPSGVQVLSAQTYENRNLFVVQETGTYRAIVDANTTVTGSYSFRFLDAADASLAFLNTPFQTQAIDANTTKLIGKLATTVSDSST